MWVGSSKFKTKHSVSESGSRYSRSFHRSHHSRPPTESRALMKENRLLMEMVVEQNVASQRTREVDIARRERNEQLRVERDEEKGRQQLLMMEQNVKQTQEAME
eukprot:4116653-Alexandrium_andersonii.AAC.1